MEQDHISILIREKNMEKVKGNRKDYLVPKENFKCILRKE
jgi:hypothetical protein